MQHNFRELRIWQDGLKIVKLTYSICRKLPADERFGLVNQMQRCSVSIPSNIAEGSGRTTEKEFVQFLNFAISSSYELETQMLLARDLFELDIEQELKGIHDLQRMMGAFKRNIKHNFG